MLAKPKPGAWFNNIFEPPTYVLKDQRVARRYQEFIDTLADLFGVDSVPIFHVVKPSRRKEYSLNFVEATAHAQSLSLGVEFISFEARPFHSEFEILWALAHEFAHLLQFQPGKNADRWHPHAADFADELGDVMRACGLDEFPEAARALAFEVVYSSNPEYMALVAMSMGWDTFNILHSRESFNGIGGIMIERLYEVASTQVKRTVGVR